MDGSGVRRGREPSDGLVSVRVACGLAMIVKWDPFQPVTGNVQKGRSECATSSETLRNLVHRTAFFIAFSLFVLLLFGKLM